LGLAFMESSTTEFVSMYITGRQAKDPLGTMQTPVDVFPGEAAYGGIRGGDYSAVTVDPVDDTFWAANMYKPSYSFWGTGIAHFTFADELPPGAVPPPAPAEAGQQSSIFASAVPSAAIPGNQ